MCAKECPLLCIYSVPANSAINCGDPGTPTNGQRSFSRTTPGYAVTYTCDVGYTLQGSNSRTCQSNGQWSGSVPQCNGMLVWVTGQILHDQGIGTPNKCSIRSIILQYYNGNYVQIGV